MGITVIDKIGVFSPRKHGHLEFRTGEQLRTFRRKHLHDGLAAEWFCKGHEILVKRRPESAPPRPLELHVDQLLDAKVNNPIGVVPLSPFRRRQPVRRRFVVSPSRLAQLKDKYGPRLWHNALGRSRAKSYFRDCPRDEEGHCLPRNEADRSGRPGERGTPRKSAVSSVQPKQPSSGELPRGMGLLPAEQPRTSALPVPKTVSRLNRFRNLARRRKVLAGLRSEAELSKAISGHNLPDSEPADVMVVVSPNGEMLSASRDFNSREFLKAREMGLRMRRQPPAPLPTPEEVEDLLRHQPPATRASYRLHLAEERQARATAEAAAAAHVEFFEVKTLTTQTGTGKIQMSAKAKKRKERWSERYRARFYTVAFDRRRGGKHSGNLLYYRSGVGSAKLADMKAVGSFDDLMEYVAMGGAFDELVRGVRVA